MRDAACPWVIPDTWQWALIGEVTSVVGGGTPRTDVRAFWDSGDVPWITPADLSGYGSVHISRGGRSISRQGLDASGARLMPAGTVLMSSRAPVGYVAVASAPVATNQGFKSFLPTGAFVPEYLYWFLRGNRRLLLDYASGTTFQEVSGKNAARIPVPIAPLAEQRRIVAAIEEHLSRLDAAVAGLMRVRTQVAQYRNAVLHAAVQGKLGPEATASSWEEPCDGDPAPDPAEVGEVEGLWALPTGWRWLRLDAVGDVLLGRQRAPQHLTGRFSKPYLRVANVSEDHIDLTDLKEMDFDDREVAKYRLEPGDILLSEGQSPELVGESAIYAGGVRDLCFQKTLHRFRANGEFASVDWCQTVFKAYRRAGVFRQAASLTVNIAHLTLERIRAIPFPLPPCAAAKQIVAEVQRRLSLIDDVDRQVQAAMARATRLRWAVLGRAFSGQLVPQDPADEPASVLLERIRASQSDTTLAGRGTRRRQPTVRQR